MATWGCLPSGLSALGSAVALPGGTQAAVPQDPLGIPGTGGPVRHGIRAARHGGAGLRLSRDGDPGAARTSYRTRAVPAADTAAPPGPETATETR